ncbi:MAG TPA: hypothetical protein VKA46_18595 [Gemmataceae bacterium]|nr:hypothetical protein [Gemmataceae bacterium]
MNDPLMKRQLDEADSAKQADISRITKAMMFGQLSAEEGRKQLDQVEERSKAKQKQLRLDAVRRMNEARQKPGAK